MIADSRRRKDYHAGRSKRRRRERGTTTTGLDNGGLGLGAVAVAGCVYVVSHDDNIGLDLACWEKVWFHVLLETKVDFMMVHMQHYFAEEFA
jgi:hypothetical protein